MAVAMRALDAVVEVVAADGHTREIPIADFHRLPGETPQRDNALATDDLITSVVLPRPLGGVQIYRKVRDRASYAFALVSVAAIIVRDERSIRQARLAFGGLAPKPWRVDAAERRLIGTDGISVAGAAADLVLVGARGYGHNDFKIPLVRRTLHAVLAKAMEA
jgi:xanthine dehydrogenase YagS FAD-binding subunit